MGETKYRQDHHAGATPEARIANRLRNSGDSANADVVVKKGDSPLRTYTNIHHSRVHSYGPDAKGVGIDGHERGPANRRGEI
jgi:hypothetical protein